MTALWDWVTGDARRFYERHLSPALSPILQMAERAPRAGLGGNHPVAGRRAQGAGRE